MKKRAIPEFKNEKDENKFWQEHDSTDFIDWDEAEPVIFSQLKPTTKSISIRLPVTLIENLKYLANKRDVPYQSFLKLILEERIHKEVKISNKIKKKISHSINKKEVK